MIDFTLRVRFTIKENPKGEVNMNTVLWQKLNKLYREDEIFQDFNGYILIKEGNELLFKQSFGYSDFSEKKVADEHTVYNIGSITKQFTAMSIVMMEMPLAVPVSVVSEPVNY